MSSSINRFPWQDDILRGLHAGEAASIDDLADIVTAKGYEPDTLKEEIAENVDHLVHLGLAEYADGQPDPDARTPDSELFRREVRLTPAGVDAASSLP
jgi:hypothetical protein